MKVKSINNYFKYGTAIWGLILSFGLLQYLEILYQFKASLILYLIVITLGVVLFVFLYERIFEKRLI